MTQIDSEVAVSELKSTFQRFGTHVAMAYLNSLSPYRFTCLYRFDGDTARNITFYDRENPGQEMGDDIPIMATYCVFMRDSGGPYQLEDSLQDPKLEGHPSQKDVRSYCGVPLMKDSGEFFGSACHFDFVPHPFSPKDRELLEHLAKLTQHERDL